jgi:hypothetical protein
MDPVFCDALEDHPSGHNLIPTAIEDPYPVAGQSCTCPEQQV